MSDNQKEIKDNKYEITVKGLVASLICGLLIGGIVYCLTKIFKLNEWYWYIPFFLFPPIIGGIIYMKSKK